MDRNYDDTIHTLLQPGGIYFDYYYPFKYWSIIRYDHGKVEITYPLIIPKIEHEIVDGTHNVKISPASRRFTNEQFRLKLVDLLNSDFNNVIQNVKMYIADYRAIMDLENPSQENIEKATADLVNRFEVGVKSLKPFFHKNTIYILRDELIVDFYNRYNKDIAKSNSDYTITSEYLNGCVNGIMKFINPLLTAIDFLQGKESDLQSDKKDFEALLRKFLITKVLPLHWVHEITMSSPLEEISDSLTFLVKSCEFLSEYQNGLKEYISTQKPEIKDFTPIEKLEICVILFSTESLKEDYHCFCKKWGSISTSYGEDISYPFNFMRVKMDKRKVTDFHNLLSKNNKPLNKKFLESKGQEFMIDNFSSLIFLTLLEMIRNGDASQDSKSKKKNTYIIRCQNCGRFFIPERSNICYCDQKAPGSDKTCSEVGAKQRHRQSRTDAEKKYATIKTRIEKKIADAAKVPNNNRKVGALREKQSKWEKQVTAYNEQLIAETITDAEYITSIESAYDNLFRRKRDASSLEK